jgi:hypothetical protein
LAENRARYSKVSNRRAAADAALAEVDNSIRVIDDAEAAAWRDWGLNPDAPQPESRRTERAKLGKRRDAVLDELESSRRAEASVAPLVRQLSTEIERISAQLFNLRLRVAVERAADLHAEAVECAAEVAASMQPILALRQYLAAEIGTAQARGEKARSDALAGALQAIADLEPPLVRADGATVARELEAWRAAMR